MAQTIEKQGDYYILRFDPAREDGVTACAFSAQTIASWSALLGLENTEEAIAAIVSSKEPRDAYDPKTGRNAWTDAYDALEATLDDSAPPSNLMAVDGSGRVEPNPLVAAYNKTRSTLGLGLMKSPTPGAFLYSKTIKHNRRLRVAVRALIRVAWILALLKSWKLTQIFRKNYRMRLKAFIRA